MARKMVVVSDLTNEPILDESQAVQVIVHTHPDLEVAVQLDGSMDEVKNLINQAKPSVVVEVIGDGGDYREKIVVDLEDFEAAFKVDDIKTVLEEADTYREGGFRPVTPPAPQRPVRAAKPDTEKVNYKELPNAGMPHRGRTTEEEALIVRENLDEVNKNRVAAGHPPIDPSNEKDRQRYGF